MCRFGDSVDLGLRYAGLLVNTTLSVIEVSLTVSSLRANCVTPVTP